MFIRSFGDAIDPFYLGEHDCDFDFPDELGANEEFESYALTHAPAECVKSSVIDNDELPI